MDLAEKLVGVERARRPQPMTAREWAAGTVSAAAFVGVVALLFELLPSDRTVHPLLVLGLFAGYLLISSVEFEVGAGYAVPESLLFVPMLFLLPLPLVPVVVASVFVLTRVVQAVRREVHPDRALWGLSDAWFSVGPVVVLGLLAPGDPQAEQFPVYALAAIAQGLATVVPALAHLRVGKGLRAADALRSVWWSLRVDFMLWPVGLMAAIAAQDTPAILVVIAPLVWLLSVFSRERRERYAAALELNRAYRGTVMLLADVVEADDNYTADHCRSVVELVTAVAEELEISVDERQELEFAALLHDVGKIAIPKEILNKPGKLTDDEFELMKTHTIEGQHMLNRVGGLLARVGRIVRSCHERWDGRGYPDGLAGEEIPLAARIVFCCDAYNAMTTNRPYRSAMPVQDALSELRENAGTQFDPWVVAALVRVVERGIVEPRITPADAVRAVFTQHKLAGAAMPSTPAAATRAAGAAN